MDFKQIFGKHYGRLRAEAILKAVISGVGIGFAVNGIFALVYWTVGFGAIWLGAALGLPLGIVFGILFYFLSFRLSEKTVAGRIDRCGLEERMITMVELSSDGSEMANIQRKDALNALSTLPSGSVRLRFSALLSALVAVTVTLSLIFSLLGCLALYGKMPYGKDLFSEGAVNPTVRYTAEDGGYIKGEGTQTVSFGGSTSAVRAVPDNGWIFLRWSDGEKSPERSEENVTSSLSFKAIFEKIDPLSPDEEDSDSADDLPYGSVIEESGGGSSDQLGGDNVKDDGDGSGGGKWQDRNQFIDGATYYRDYLEFYYNYATGIFESESDIPPEILEFFEMYFDGI